MSSAMPPPLLFSMRCAGGTNNKKPDDRFSEWATLLTTIKVARGKKSQLLRHGGVGLFAASLISSECPFMTCRRREKRSRASVELWERTQKPCLVQTLPRVHSRKNRLICFASCIWLSMDLPIRRIPSDQPWFSGPIRKLVKTVFCRCEKSRSCD